MEFHITQLSNEEMAGRIQVCRKERWVKRENALPLAPVKGVWPTGQRICRGKASLTEWSWFRFVKSAVSAVATARRQHLVTYVGQTRHIALQCSTKLKRVSGISKWCRFIQGWKIYALGVENLKWQEEKLSSSLGMGSSKMHYSW